MHGASATSSESPSESSNAIPSETSRSADGSTGSVFTGPEREFICSEVWGGNRSVSRDIRLPGLSGVVYSCPCKGDVGGDVYYLSACSAGLVARLCIADVVGHGETVTQISDWMYELLRKNMNRPNPARIFRELNRRATSKGIGAMTTALCLTYYSFHRRLYYCYAGHHAAYLFRDERDQWEALRLREPDGADPRNLPLGVAAEARYDVSSTLINEGDRLFIFTDGVLEARRDNGDMFGEERVIQFLNDSKSTSVHETGESLIRELHSFCGHRGILDHDDVSFVMVEAGHAPRGSKIWHLIRNNVRKFMTQREKAEPGAGADQ